MCQPFSGNVKVARYAILLILIHALVAALHGAAHVRLYVQLSLSQNIFVVVVITVLPLVAGLLIWKKRNLSGAGVLLCSMTGALFFGVYNHFVSSSPDHVSHVAVMSPAEWVIVFQVTALLLVLIEASGCLIGLWMLKSRWRVSRTTT
jgi:hypothetical protein